MDKRYSEYTIDELQKEMAFLKEKSIKAEQMGMMNELAVYQRKLVMAKAYTIDPSQFKPGEIYEIESSPGETFQIEYMRGIFAWGERQNMKEPRVKQHAAEEDQEAIPISLLGKKLVEN